jgi:hypothetical protein
VRVLTDEVKSILTAGGLTVGDGTGEDMTPPYVVLYPLGQDRDGSYDAAWEDVEKRFQVTCEAVSRQQAEWLADRCDDLMLASPLVLTLEFRPGVIRDDTTGDPPRFKAYAIYKIRTYRETTWPS